MSTQRDFGHLRDHAADRKSVRTYREILMSKNVFHLQAVNDRKGPFHQRCRHLKADEVVILLRGVAILGHLHHVESKLRLQMSGVVLCVSNGTTVLCAQLRTLDGDTLVD